MRRLMVAAAAAALAAAIAIPAGAHEHGPSPVKHVLLISVDGMHQQDLKWWVDNNPGSNLAKLVAGGVSYTSAWTPVPSDSFPGMVGQVTGGNPRTTGIYYDASYNRTLLPPGTTSCAGVAPGTAVNYDESIDKDPSALDAGAGVIPPFSNVFQMPLNPQSLINTAALPVDPNTCQPVLPHQYLKVNTVFEVAKAHGLYTAWSDKHPAYEILNGPSGNGIDDLFTPEINSSAPGAGDWTKKNSLTQQYDGYKVQAVLNEIDGLDHTGVSTASVPAIFGMNFQSVSTAQKLPASDGMTGGYLSGGTTPGPLLTGALQFVDTQVGRFVAELQAKGLTGSTAIIVSAKHGQSPTDPDTLTRIDDGTITDGINADWTAAHPGAAALVVGGTNDDALQLYLSDRSPAAIRFVRNWLWTHTATGNTLSGGSRTLDHSGLRQLFAGEGAADYFGVPVSDPRHPDVWGIVQHGVVFTGGKKKIAEHGGADPQDRNVPLVISTPDGGVHGVKLPFPVETTQIAPTILRLLGLSPWELQAVRAEGTPALIG